MSKHKGKLWTFGILGVIALSLFVATRSPKVSRKLAVAFSPITHGFTNVVDAYRDAFESTQAKVDGLRRMEQEYERMRLENVNLRLKAETLLFDCQGKKASSRALETGWKLSEETGSKAGRTLASIAYRPPTHLLPPQLYTLAVSYFKAGEDEKAAVILTFLTDLDENESYKTARNFLLAGVAWYRLDNFAMADFYFDRALKITESPESLQYQAQARLWRGLVSEKIGKHVDAQQWLRDLVDHHPHSTEAAWVNSKEVRRALSSVSE